MKLTKNVTADKEEAGPPLPRIVVEIIPVVEPRRFCVLSADMKAHGHTGVCRGCAALASHGRAIKPHNNECRDLIRTIVKRTTTGKARVNAYKDTVGETERVKEKKSARVERGAGDVLVKPRSEQQMADRNAVASGEETRDNTTRTE